MRHIKNIFISAFILVWAFFLNCNSAYGVEVNTGDVCESEEIFSVNANTSDYGTVFAVNGSYYFYKSYGGDIYCLINNVELCKNQFVCDGTYTYFFQNDGTAMRSRLTYHPDGKHVIYFDEYGHEVFSDFTNVKKSIAGEAVDDLCFFDVFGYLYVDVVTYDKTGTKLYYANAYGVLEKGKWFQFSNTVKCADGTSWKGAAGHYGCANDDAKLVTNQAATDWLGRACYLQGNGVALYENSEETVTDKANKEEVVIEIDNLKGEYTFALLADLHIIYQDGQIKESSKTEISERMSYFSDHAGNRSGQLWNTFPDTLNKERYDGVLLAGDMIDFASDSNITALYNGMDMINKPVMYVKADHDFGTWYGTLKDGEANSLHAFRKDLSEVYAWEYEQFIILGIDNSTSQLSNQALASIKDIFSKGKPIIILTHVPIKPLADNSLSAQSKAAWNNRDLTWGTDTYYKPDSNTQEFLNMIYKNDSPVVEILSGHLHFSWDGSVTDRVREHVFSPAFQNSYGVVKITAKKQ